jgi:predicted nucleotidyltransferase
MKTTTQTISQITAKLAPVFVAHNVRKAILFGSYAKGFADDRSDVDLCVDSGLRGLDFMVLVDDVNECLKKDIDMFDVTHIKKNSKIDLEIANTGVIIYEK